MGQRIRGELRRRQLRERREGQGDGKILRRRERGETRRLPDRAETLERAACAHAPGCRPAPLAGSGGCPCRANRPRIGNHGRRWRTQRRARRHAERGHPRAHQSRAYRVADDLDPWRDVPDDMASDVVRGVMNPARDVVPDDTKWATNRPARDVAGDFGTDRDDGRDRHDGTTGQGAVPSVIFVYKLLTVVEGVGFEPT